MLESEFNKRLRNELNILEEFGRIILVDLQKLNGSCVEEVSPKIAMYNKCRNLTKRLASEQDRMLDITKLITFLEQIDIKISFYKSYNRDLS